MSIRTLARRTAVAATGGALAVSGLLAVAPAPSAHAAPSSAPQAAAAASWLTSELAADGLLGGSVSRTIDFALALQGVAPDEATLGRIEGAVDDNLEAYAVDGVAWSQAALFYQSRRIDPATRGGNLIAKIEGAVDDTTGEMPYPYGGAWSQALAVRALDAAGSAETSAATMSLIDDFECPTGGWGYWFAGSCTADPDNTADMLFALLPQAGDSAAIDDAIDRGVEWLKDNQRTDGGFENYAVANASSTGLAGQALASAGARAEASRAAVWLARRQVAGSPCDSKLDGERGAVAASDTVLTEGRQFGIVPAAAGYDWHLATIQSLEALAHVPAAASALSVTAPSFVHTPGSLTFRATGVADGVVGCVSVPGAAVRIGGGTTSGTLTVPATAGTFFVSLTTAGGSATAKVVSLSATKLKVKVAKTVKAKKKATVKVRGLAAGERVTVTLGKKSKTAVAKANGKAVVKVKAPKKRGKAKVKVTGQFADRTGKAKVRVV